MEMFPMMPDVARPGPAPQRALPGPVPGRDRQARPLAEEASASPGPADVTAGTGPVADREVFATASGEAAVSMTQMGLVGQAMLGLALPASPQARGSAASAAAVPPGEPRRVERVLAPWGVPLLPSEGTRDAGAGPRSRESAPDRGMGDPASRRPGQGNAEPGG